MKPTRESTIDSKPRFDVLTIFVGTAVVALTLVPYYGLSHGYSAELWAFFAAFVLWSGLSITAGYHRLWAHKAYKTALPVRLVFALGGALALQNAIRVWCSNHRRHHRFVDNPKQDPYAATRGLWYSHIGWMLRDYPAAEVTEENIRDLDCDPLVRWQSRYYWALSFALNVLLTLLIGYLLGDALGGLLLLGFLRLFICHHTTFFINSLAHYWGSRPYSDSNTARDNGVIALLTYGEGYHNFHHTFQWDYRNGRHWYQFDPTKWLIGMLSWLKLAWSLKRTPPEQIERSVVRMQLTRARAVAAKKLDAEIWLAALEHEYNALLEYLSRWGTYRRRWLDLRKQNLAQQAAELRTKLKEIEAELTVQRNRWHNLRLQFA